MNLAHVFIVHGNYNDSCLCHDSESSQYLSGTTGKPTHLPEHDTKPTCSLSPFYFNTDSQAEDSNFKSV